MASQDLVLISGATGHIGFRALILALQAGYRVRFSSRSAVKADQVLAHSSIKTLNLAPNTLSYAVVPDFTTAGAFDDAVKGVQYVLRKYMLRSLA